MTLLTWVAALRFPLLFAALLLAIGIWAARSPLLRGVFDVPPKRLWSVVITALSAAASIVVSGWVIMMGAPARLNAVPFVSTNATPILAQCLIAALLVAPVLYRVWQMSSISVPSKLLQAGFSVTTVGTISFWLNNKLDELDWLTHLFDFPFRALGPGYVDAQGRPETAHIYCVAWIGFTFGVYLAMGFWRLLYLRRAQPTPGQIPTLAVFFILISFLVSALSAVGFILDYWHVPSLTLLAACIAIAALFRSSDHTFPVTHADVPAVPPQRALEASGHENIILVAAAGGGIHLAGWTAKVLTELSRLPGFTERVRLVSSVSGGSTGSLYWLQSVFETRGHPDSIKVFTAATRSSLDSVAWGLLYPDLVRAFVPLIPDHLGRGWALERAWMRDWKFPNLLSEWRPAVLAGLMPAVLFNTTAVETGECLTFPTTDLDPRPPDLDVRRTFYEVHPHCDISPVTAARLSATFPFVTSAARSNSGETIHFADGGYYDNFGAASLAQWLRDAVHKQGHTTVKRILIVNITGCIPTVTQADQEALRRTKPASYLFQFLAPLATMLNVRNASQRTNRHIQLKLLQEAMAARGVLLDSVEFAYPNSDAPLSWHLTRQEIRDLEESWPALSDKTAIVANFIGIESANAAHGY